MSKDVRSEQKDELLGNTALLSARSTDTSGVIRSTFKLLEFAHFHIALIVIQFQALHKWVS